MASTFKKRAGTTDKGKLYGEVMIANLILKLVTDDDIQDFSLSSNDAEYGDFDDIVVEVESDYQKKMYALKLRYGNSKKMLTKSGLIEQRGNFSIQKLFENFRRNTGKYSADNVSLILYTNFKFDISQDYEIMYLKDKDFGNFKIKIWKIASEPLLNTSDRGCCYKFAFLETESATNSTLASECKIFFDKLYLYTNQAYVDSIREDVSNKFQHAFYCHQSFFNEYFDFITQLDGQKIKLNKKYMQRAIAIRLLSPFIEPFSFSNFASNDQSQILKKAIFKFDITVLEKENCDSIKKMYADVKSEIENINEINKIGIEYGVISKRVLNADELNKLELTKVLWLLDKCPLIVTANDTTYTTIKFFCKNKKIIVLEANIYDRNFETSTIFRDLSDIYPDSEIYERILQSFKISLQGKKTITLREFIDNSEEFTTIFTTNMLLKMVDGPFTTGGEKEVLPIPHIDRVISTNYIDFKFIYETSKDTLIVISCQGKFDKIKTLFSSFNVIKVDEVDEYIKKKKRSRRRDVYVSQDVCSRPDFDVIRKKNPEARRYHHFRIVDDETMEWVRSKGDIDELNKFRRNDHFVEDRNLFCFNTDEMMTNNIEIVCADPGMGKSTLAKNIKNHQSSTFWTVLIYVTKHSSYFNEKNRDVDDFIRYILDQTHRNQKDSDQKLLTILKQLGRIVFIWDGLDEIFGEGFQTVLDIIDGLFERGFKQLITSTNNLKKLLENKFKVFSRTIKPFDERQQIYYINKRLHLFKIGLDSVIKMKKIMEKLRYNDILGIPLHIFMLTEMLDGKKYRNVSDDLLSVADIYHHFIHEKFYFYYKEKEDSVEISHAMKILIETEKKSQLEQYEKAALKAVCTNKIFQELNINCEVYLNKIQEEMDRYGFITKVTIEGIPKFAHHSYAEYFAATYFYKNHDKINKLEEFLFEERYRNVRHFFDLLLAGGSPMHIAVLHQNFDVLSKYKNQLNIKDQGGRNVLHLACSWGATYPSLKIKKNIIDDTKENSIKDNSKYKKILKLLSQNCDPYEEDEVFKLNSFLFADKSSCLFPFIKLLSVHKMCFDDFVNVSDISTFLYYSLKFDYSEVFNILKNIPNIETKDEQNSLLHISAKHNAKNCLKRLLSETTFTEKINDGNRYGNSPMFLACSYGHTEIVRTLINAKADVNIANKADYTPIYVACQNGHIDVVQLLIHFGASINFTTTNRNIPMIAASSNGHSEIVRLLINVNVDPNFGDNEGYTPMYMACQNGHTNVVQVLLEFKADVNAAKKDDSTPIIIASLNGHVEIVRMLIYAGAHINIADNDGYTPIYMACKRGHIDVVQLLIAETNVNAATNDGGNAMVVASSNGHSDIVRMLIKANADVNIADDEGYSPMYVACRNGHNDVVELLIDVGANVNALRKDGSTPMITASLNGYCDIVQKLILSNADVNIANNKGYTPMHVACKNGHNDVVLLLLSVNANVNAPRKDGSTPIMIAALNGHSDTVRILINAKADVNIADNEGYTPMHLACKNGHINVVNLLIKFKANVNAARIDGSTPIIIASLNGNVKVVPILINAKADVNLADDAGCTPIYVACENGHIDTVQLLLDFKANVNVARKDGSTPMIIASLNGYVEIVRLLINSETKVNITNNEGYTPLHVACMNEHVDIVELLLESEANVNVTTKDGHTPIWKASFEGHSDIVRMLINVKANVNLADNKGYTPLHVACMNGHVDTVELLLESKAHVNVTTKDGHTPIWKASFEGHSDIVRLLIATKANVNLADNEGYTPIYVACMNNHANVVKQLINSQANVNIASKDGSTPVDIASFEGYFEIVGILLSAKAKLNVVDNGGYTPMDVARINGRAEVVQLLMDAEANLKAATENDNR